MANLNLNKVVLAGRLTADVELKQTTSGVSVCSFNLAVNRKPIKDKPQETDFIKCVAWRQTAEFIARYFKKGSSLCVVGNIQTRKWTDQDGKERFSTEVIVDEAMFVDSKSDGQASAADTYIPYAYKPTEEAPKFEEINTDDAMLPF